MSLDSKKTQTCELFVAAMYQHAVEIASEIASEVSHNGETPTLTDDDCILIFSSEWCLAKFAWLSRQTGDIKDRELRQRLDTLVHQKVQALSSALKDGQNAFLNYYMLADAFDKGDRDSMGLAMGPGPFLSDRYQKTLAEMTSVEPSNLEMMLILTAGDTCCWQLGSDINTGLSDIMESLGNESSNRETA